MKKYSEMTLEEKKQEFQKLNLIDDALFHKVCEDLEAAEELIQVLLGNKSLRIVEAKPQMYLRNIANKSVQLDLICTDETGRVFAVEVQKSDDDDHVKRVRYNISNIDTSYVEKGIYYKELPDIYTIFISKFDIFKLGKTVYHVDKRLREDCRLVDCGVHEYYVYAGGNDESEVTLLMQYFLDSNGKSEAFPKISSRVENFKTMNTGVDNMCEFTEWILNEGREEGLEKGKVQATLNIAKNMKLKGMDIPTIIELTGLSMAEVEAI